MEKRLIPLVTILIITALLVAKFLENKKQILVKIQPTPLESSESTNSVQFFNQELFDKGISEADRNFIPAKYKIKGAVTSHHDLVSSVIAGTFKQISTNNPTTIILIGPNHYERGQFKVTTSTSSWNTTYGTVKTNVSVANALISNNLAGVDDTVITQDHATTLLLPYIKFYMPNVIVVQLLIKKNFTFNDAKKLSDFLITNFNDNSVIVASVDFSHYLTAADAINKDEETITAINNFDYPKLFNYGSEHMDSPGSLSTLLMTMQGLGTTQKEILYHGNSSDVKSEYNSYVTSYYSMLFY